MKEYFYVIKDKATPDMVYKYVEMKRPDASRKSIEMYLYLRDEFVMVAPNEYELSEWGNDRFVSNRKIKKPVRGKTKRESIQEHIRSYLTAQPGKRALVRNVLIYVKHHEKNCIDRTFYSYLTEMSDVKKEYINRKLYCYISGKDILLFISYSHQDKDFVDILETNLEHTKIPYFRDVHDLMSGPIESQNKG